MGTARLKITIVLDSGARIGPGKARLLGSIRDTGSISAAAREMGMSYKRAWLLLDGMNQAFAGPVVKAAPGGARGGGAVLTLFGADVLARYDRIVDTFPPDTDPPIVYPIALTASSGNPDAPSLLVFLRGAAARAQFQKAGFSLLNEAR